MQSLEAECDEGERAVKRLKALRAAVQPLSSPRLESQATTSDFDEKHSPSDIFDELQTLYDDENTSSETDEDEGIEYKSLLLEKLVAKKKLNTVILNLYPGNKGYSLAFRTQDRNMCFKEGTDDIIETNTRPYEDDDLLRYLDKEELPPFMLDALDQFDFLFYNGCIIAEVRDYRQAYPHTKCYIHHVLLRPTQKTLLADINNLTKDRNDLTSEDRDFLESQLLVAQTPELCLDPDPYIENELAEIHNRKQLWNAHPYRRIARKYSQVTVNKKRKLDHLTHRHGLELYEYARAKRCRPQTPIGASQSSRTILKKTIPEEMKTGIPIPLLDGSLVMPPSQPIVINEFKALSWPEDTCDCAPQLMEEYILETDMPSKDKDTPRVYHIKLSIFQRPSNLEFLGELYLDRDHKKDERNGVACRFSLGSRANAHRYVRQFTEIFTESGRKTARIRCGLSGSARAEGVARATTQAQPHPREHIDRLTQALQTQKSQPINNQELESRLEINALATKLMNSAQQFQAAANAKQQHAAQQQKLLSSNTNILNLLNTAPASACSDATGSSVANPISSSGASSQRLLPKKMTLSAAVAAGGARVINHSNLITLNNRVNLSDLNGQLNHPAATAQTVTLAPVNNNRISLGELNAQLAAQTAQQQPQTVTLTPVNTGSYNYTTMPVKQQVINHRILNVSAPSTAGSVDGVGSSSPTPNKSAALSALLVGTPAADRPDIVGPNTNSLLLEKLAAAGGQNPFTPKASQQQTATPQFLVQSPKANTVISPMSSPPPQPSGTLNVQSLNLAQLQSISGLQNVQVQLPGFAQPISLALNVSGQVTGAGGTHAGLLVSLPPSGVATQTQAIATQSSQQPPTVQGVVLNAGTAGPSQLAHLVGSTAVKNITHQNLRAASGSQTVQLTQGSPQFQLISQLQRTNRQQNVPNQANITSRTLQRTPITIKMAPSTSQLTDIQFNFDS